MSVISTPLCALALNESNKHFYSNYGVLPKVGVIVAGLGVSGYIAAKCICSLNSTIHDRDAVKSSEKEIQGEVMLTTEKAPERSIEMESRDARLKSAEVKFTEMESTKVMEKEIKGEIDVNISKFQKQNVVSRFNKRLFFTLKEKAKFLLECLMLCQLSQIKCLVPTTLISVFSVFAKTYTSDKIVCSTKDVKDDNNDNELFAEATNSPLFTKINTNIVAHNESKINFDGTEALNVNEYANSKNNSEMYNQDIHRKKHNNFVNTGNIAQNEIANTNINLKNDDVMCGTPINSMKKSVDDDHYDDVDDNSNKHAASKLQHNQTSSSATKYIVTKDVNWPHNIVNRTKALGMVHALIRKIQKDEGKKSKIDKRDRAQDNIKTFNKYNDNNNDTRSYDDDDDDDDEYIDDDEVTDSDTTDVSLNYHIATSMERETYDELVEFLNERKVNNSLLSELNETNNKSALLEVLTKIAEYLDISNEREKLRERRAYLHFSDGAERETNLAGQNVHNSIYQSEMVQNASKGNVVNTDNNISTKNSIDSTECDNAGEARHFDGVTNHEIYHKDRLFASAHRDDKNSTTSSNNIKEMVDKTLMSTKSDAKAAPCSENNTEEANKVNVKTSRLPVNTALEENLKKSYVPENKWSEDKEKLDAELFEHGWGAQDYYNQDRLENFERYLAEQDDDDDADFMTYLEQNDAAEQFYNRDEIRLRRRDPANRMRIISQQADLFEGIGDAHALGNDMNVADRFARVKADEIDSADDFYQYFNSQNYSPDYDDYLHTLYTRGKKNRDGEKQNEIMKTSANQEHLIEHELQNKRHSSPTEEELYDENKNSNNKNNNNVEMNKKDFTLGDQVKMTNEIRQLHRTNKRLVEQESKKLNYLSDEQENKFTDKKAGNNNAVAKVNLREKPKNIDRTDEGKINDDDAFGSGNDSNIDSENGYCDEYDYDEYMEKLFYDNYMDDEQKYPYKEWWELESEESESEYEDEEEWKSEEDEEVEEEQQEEEDWEEQMELEEEEEKEIEEEELPLKEKLAFEEELIDQIYNLAHQLKVSQAMGQKELDAANASRERRHAAVRAENESKRMQVCDKISQEENHEEKEQLGARWQDNRTENEKVDSSGDDCDEWEDVSSTDS